LSLECIQKKNSIWNFIFKFIVFFCWKFSVEKTWCSNTWGVGQSSSKLIEPEMFLHFISFFHLCTFLSLSFFLSIRVFLSIFPFSTNYLFYISFFSLYLSVHVWMWGRRKSVTHFGRNPSFRPVSQTIVDITTEHSISLSFIYYIIDAPCCYFTIHSPLHSTYLSFFPLSSIPYTHTYLLKINVYAQATNITIVTLTKITL
jgi:hypothetical protein